MICIRCANGRSHPGTTCRWSRDPRLQPEATSARGPSPPGLTSSTSSLSGIFNSSDSGTSSSHHSELLEEIKQEPSQPPSPPAPWSPVIKQDPDELMEVLGIQERMVTGARRRRRSRAPTPVRQVSIGTQTTAGLNVPRLGGCYRCPAPPRPETPPPMPRNPRGLSWMSQNFRGLALEDDPSVNSILLDLEEWTCSPLLRREIESSWRNGSTHRLNFELSLVLAMLSRGLHGVVLELMSVHADRTNREARL